MKREEVQSFFRSFQDELCNSLSQLDGQSVFTEDTWSREGGGGGITRVMQNGALIEKGGVNFSAVSGTISPALRREIQIPENQECYFHASGVSVVLHPLNPFVPIIHMNVRYFEIIPGDGFERSAPPVSTQWFGGGIDLTPHYVDRQDAAFFHRELKVMCDKHHPGYYERFSKWAEDYFFIAHRNESRGVGGVFFDRLCAEENMSMERQFAFVKSAAAAFFPLYSAIAGKNRKREYGSREKNWQLLRRARYAEFNLIYDRGTKFGLESGGRPESIFISLPPSASWIYNFIPTEGSPEAETLSLLKKRILWEKEQAF